MIGLYQQQTYRMREIAEALARKFGIDEAEALKFLKDFLFPSHCPECLSTKKSHSPGWAEDTSGQQF
jgi:hypothetical protein